ncbi:MAG: transcription antiterminator [Coprobacillus sp.]
MDNITKRQQRILLVFLETKQFLTSQKLSALIHLSTKTVRNEIKALNQVIEEFAFIQSQPAQGYHLIIKDEKKLEYFKRTFNGEWDAFIPSTPLERAYYILGLMLKEKDFIKIDDISEMLFIDRTSVSRSLKYIRECLERFGLQIIQKTGKGLKIVGNEFHYRQCMSEYLYHKPETLLTEIGKNDDFINKLKEVIYEDGISMPERVFHNFIIHIQVQMNRILDQCFIEFTSQEQKQIENEYEYLVAKDVARVIHHYFHIEFSREEIDYLTIHILGKKSNSTSAIESCINNQLKKEIDDIVLQMLNRIDDVFNIDFKDDMYLRKAIGIHINPMENRLKFNTYLRNPLIYAIKEKYTYAYLMSLEAWKVIGNYTDYINIEDEIGYIAIHFQYAIERKKRTHLKKRVLLVNDFSVATSELLSFSILRKYKDKLVIENTISVSEIKSYDLSKYDFLITTVPIYQELQIPIIKINPIISNKNLDLLKRQLDNHNQNLLIDYIKKDDIVDIDGDSSEQILERIYQRESISYDDFYHLSPLNGFELSNQIAIHYVKANKDKSSLSIYSLPKQVIWKNKFVKIVLLLKIGNDSERMLDSLSTFLSKSKNIDILIQESCLDAMYNYIQEMSSYHS